MATRSRKRLHFTPAEIEAQLQNLYLYSDFSSSYAYRGDQTAPDSSLGGTGVGAEAAEAENLEHLGPIIRNIHLSKQQDAFLRHLTKFTEEKEAEIEQVCRTNYQDFIGSVDKLLKVRQGTLALRSHVTALDSQLQSSGASLANARSQLLDNRRVASNIDETIETLQACLRVLDLSKKIGEQIDNGKYYSALRSLDDLQHTHLKPLLPFAEFAGYLGAALPGERARIRDEVTKQLKTWLFDAREACGNVGRLALEAMETRNRRWKARRERALKGKEGRGPSEAEVEGAAVARLANVNTPVEMAISERHEYDVLDHENGKIDFRPLYQCIHIYDALGAREDLQHSYQEDRRAQAFLILSSFSNESTTGTPAHPTFSLDALASLMESIVGFFIIETHVLRTTRSFRSEQDVDDLWDEMCEKVVGIVGNGLKGCEDPEVFLGTKLKVLTFVQTLEGYEYGVDRLNALLLTLFERYSELLQRKFGADFEQIVLDDDHQSMVVNDLDEFTKVATVSFLPHSGEWSQTELARHGFPMALPFSQTYPLCCIDIRNFVHQYYQFADGFVQANRDIDDILRKSLDRLLIDHVGSNIRKRIKSTGNLSQLSQIVVNTLFFQTACAELETLLVTLRASQRGGAIQLDSLRAFHATLEQCEDRILMQVNAKTKDFFGLAEYDWAADKPPPPGSDRHPSEWLQECLDYLNTVMNSVLVQLPPSVRINIYHGAMSHIANGLMSFFTDADPSRMSDAGLAYLAIDVRFAAKHASAIGLDSLPTGGDGPSGPFTELTQLVTLLQSTEVAAYLDAQYRAQYYGRISTKKLAPVLVKLLTYMNAQPTVTDPKRKHEMEEVLKAVSRLSRTL